MSTRDATSGWNTFAAEDRWTECSAAIFAPKSGLLEILATGLEGQEVQFRVDDALSAAYVLPPRHNAYTSRPVLQGHHRVAVRWRGEHGPSKIEARFLYLSRTLSELERDAPDVAAVMKKNNPANFELCDLLILSQPPTATCQVYGIFTIDRKALASGRRNAPVIKQDFLVNDRSANPPEITYYTGYPSPGPHRSIEEFCARFGPDHYGCERVGNKWRCRDHRFTLEQWKRAAVEPGIRAAVQAAIDRASTV